MANYLNAFYGAANAFCSVMTSVTYANEIQGKNLISENNKLLGPGGFTYHLGGHPMVISGQANMRVPTGVCAVEGTNSQYYIHVCGTWTYCGGNPESFDWYVGRKSLIDQIEHAKSLLTARGVALPSWFPTSLKTSPTQTNTNEIVTAYNYMVQMGYVGIGHAANWSPTRISNATISQLVNYEASLAAKGGTSANTMQAWQQQVQAANTAFSNIKNQAQAGVSQVSGWVQTDGDEMTAAVNMLSSVLQGLASPVTVS
jgi:hypothetical protein